MSSISPIWHPMTQHGMGVPEIHIESAKDEFLYAKGGRRIIDGISSWWVITHGHCREEIVQAVQRQASKLEQVIFSGFTHEPAEELTNALLGFFDPAHEFIFYSDSGSTAIEIALKMAIGTWSARGESRGRVLALDGGYHGDTFGAMAAGARGVFNAPYDPFLFDVDHLPVPIVGQEDMALSALEALLAQQGHSYAAFIFEPLVQGAAGMRMYSPEMLKAMCDMCQRYGILLIADEVMTGFGRTGSMFACQAAGVVPDLVALSKGLTGGFLPMGATLATRDIYMSFYGPTRSNMFFHSTSFTANPLACAAALASAKIWQDDDVVAQISGIESQHREFVERILSHERIESARYQGSICAVDLKVKGDGSYLSDITPRLYQAFLDRNVLLRPIGATIYILPPYNIGRQSMGEIYSVLLSVLEEAW